ncbi:hypothetical protein [Phaeodactylibacter sp.]|uniref:hypothetical protein n=1 Tax=Phaeodactylibacter sp. TaxID=1940289 RepID=UPI0025D760D4|nr:hypothetical protein [Phaeodactylibacter sp.]MCI4650821.1 hypothetical protein [Phaeodactylibacter sp.]MCI5089778.1 hypothetical protein [Phaeodactylibacter sp.]
MKPTITLSDQFQLDPTQLTTTLRFEGKAIASKDVHVSNITQAHIEILAEEANKAMRYLCIHLPSDSETYRWIMNYHSLWKSDADQLEYIAQPKNAAFLRKRVAAMPDTKNGKGCKTKMLFLNALITYYDNHFGESQPTGGVPSCHREAG